MNIEETLSERGSRYGKFSSHAQITQDLKLLIASHTPGGRRLLDNSYGDFLAPDQQEALDMICHKIGRILNGDPDYADSWHDIAGYAQLVANRLNEKSVKIEEITSEFNTKENTSLPEPRLLRKRALQEIETGLADYSISPSRARIFRKALFSVD